MHIAAVMAARLKLNPPMGASKLLVKPVEIRMGLLGVG
ncbi:hypothetical protein JCM19233_6398 [Vibrio astriarenae]|nr:hypothetical protein JCM19233_6398 [Vibrio sp. C7]